MIDELKAELELVRWRLKHGDFEFPKTGRATAEKREKELEILLADNGNRGPK